MTTQPDDLGYPYERALQSTFPQLHRAQNEWLDAIDSLTSPDRRTHELVRLACVVILRNEAAVERHARLAREMGATWDDVVGTILLTQPAFGVQPAAHAIPIAQRVFDEPLPD